MFEEFERFRGQVSSAIDLGDRHAWSAELEGQGPLSPDHRHHTAFVLVRPLQVQRVK
jgi:hypothetical protein